MTFRRNPDYWAKDLPAKRGFDNYDKIRLNYFRDENAMFEAFKKGLIDVFLEENSGRWTHDYDFPAAVRGDVVKEEIRTRLPSGMFGLVMNTRRKPFDDPRLREALVSLFDFEWVNRNLLTGAYQRTRSFYDNSELSSFGRPASAGERKLLAPFPDAVRAEILAGGWQPPSSDGTGRDRHFLRAGFDKLKAAGYAIDNGKLVGPDGRQLSFEIMLKAGENEQLATAWQQTLSRLGIAVSIRSVDAAQFQQRLTGFDFDVVPFLYASSLSPGVEQVARWGSVSRDVPGTFNYAGVANPAVDAMIDAVINARDRMISSTRSGLTTGCCSLAAILVPLYFKPEQWIAHWRRIKRPAQTPLYGSQLPAWWYDPS